MARRNDRQAVHRRQLELVELITARTNATPLSAVARMLAACSRLAPFSLEIVGTPSRRSFLLRGSGATVRHLEQQIGAAYPQAELRPLDTPASPGLDPATLAADEQVAACALVLRAPPHLPLRTFRDSELAAERTPQADPMLAILGALAALPEGWRALSQLVLHPAPSNWDVPYRRLALELPLQQERTAGTVGGPSGGSVAGMGALVLLLVAAPTALQWYATQDWLHLGLLIGGFGGALPAALAAKARLGPRPPHDPALVREKLAHGAYLAQIRLAVFAPASAAGDELLARLERLVAAYSQFDLPTGNGLEERALRLRDGDLTTLAPLPVRRSGLLGGLPGAAASGLLNVQELAGLWHLPQAQADVPFLERTTARRWTPLPASVASGCRIGSAERPGGSIPVALPEELLHRHLLLIAKTRRGKSSLLLRLAQHLMAETGDGAPPALVLVDPHRDLALAALGLVPPHRHDDVVYLDVAEEDFPFGLNLLDTGLGWTADRAVANALMVFRRQWDQFWGPRMEDVFRMTLHTLYAANERRCAADPAARAAQYTILEIPALLADLAFRKVVLQEAGDASIAEWWHVYFEGSLDRRLRMDAQNPVLTKINRLAASRSSRALLGQPCSSITPAEWVRDGRLVIVHTAQGMVGEDTAALIGGTLLNLVRLEVQAQASLPPARRRRVCLIVDEFHTMPGADYEAFLGELAKFQSSLILATQALARQEVLDRAHERALRSTLFSNLDGLFAFHCSAEDARYLEPELGGELEVADLVSLGDYQCYARLWAGGERLPVFSVRLDPPPVGDPDLAARLAVASARRHGRPRQAIEAARAAVLERIEESQRRAVVQAARTRAQLREDPPRRSRDQGPDDSEEAL